MRRLPFAAALAVTGCGAAPQVCGLSSNVSFDLDFIVAAKDGQELRAAGTYTPSGLVSGSGVSLDLARDETGAAVSEKLARGQFPICVNLGENAATTSFAQYLPPGNTYSTDAEHTGRAALIGFDGDRLKGLFRFRARNTRGGAPVVFEMGRFLVNRAAVP